MISKKVYIASDGFNAFIDRGHDKHVTSGAFFRYFAMENFQLYTTFLTVHKTYEYLDSNIGTSLAKDYLRAIYMSSINLLYPEPSDVKSAIKLVAQSSTTDLSFSKALMMVICNKRNIPQICTFDFLHSFFGLKAFYLPI
jgi:predicted nucleic acid-binding protein